MKKLSQPPLPQKDPKLVPKPEEKRVEGAASEIGSEETEMSGGII